MNFEHTSVLLNEAIAGLNIKPDGIYVDGTLGGGGHAQVILGRLSQKGKLIGIDRDSDSLLFVQNKLISFKDRLQLIKGNFRDISDILDGTGINKIDGVLLDLGVSSHQLTHEQRGFSFKGDAPLDMRMGEGKLTAAIILNTYSVQDLERVFRDYGEERHAKGIAQRVVEERKVNRFESTSQFTALVEKFYRGKTKPGKKISPATKVYQALRIEVNDELGSIRDFLNQIIPLLMPQARICIISFHSLEDRLIKQFFKDNSLKLKHNKYATEENPVGALTVITSRPIEPSAEEIAVNPRSRSAKLRIAEKT